MTNYHQNCLICGSGQLTELEDYRKDYLCRCDNCRFVFARKIPSEAELISHYEGYGRNDYLSPLTIKRYNEILDGFEEYRKTNRILDIGCGIGYFLQVARDRGWEVHGTEYTDDAIRICQEQGIDMQQGKLDAGNYLNGAFDVVTSFEVIEHINNPRQDIGEAFQVLRPGGLYYLTTPNFNSLLRYRLKSEYNVICYPEHLSYYTPGSIKRLFESAGFETVKVKTTGISLTRFRTSRKVSKQSFISATSDDEKIRQKLESNGLMRFAKTGANEILSLFGVGDTLKGYFEKKAA